MKKLAYILLGALLLASCDMSFLDDEWSGTYIYGESAGMEYMFCVADNLVVDNLGQMETALFVDSIHSTTSTRFETSGSIWDADCKWTVSKKGSVLPGLVITRAAADSTWNLKRTGKYAFPGGSEFDTEYDMDVRMLKDTTSRPVEGHYWWQVTIKKCIRTEDNGYRAELITPTGSVLEYTYGRSMGTWGYCHGILSMMVYKNGELLDVARLQLNGTRYESKYLRDL